MNKIIFCLLVLLIALKVAWVYTKPLMSDDYVHYFLARYILQHGTPYFFQSGYLMPDWGVTQLPLYHYILAFFMLFLPLWFIRYLFAIAIPLITTYFVWKLFYKYDPSGVAATLFNFVPFYFIWSSTLYIDATFALFSLITIYYYFNNKNRWIIFYIMTMFLKYYIGAGLLFIFIYDSWKTKRYKKLWIFILLTVLILPIHYYVNSLTMDVIESAFAMKYGNNRVLMFISMAASIYPNELFEWDLMYTMNYLIMTGAPLFFVFTPLLWKKHKMELIWVYTYFTLMIFGSPDSRRMILTAPLVFMSIWMIIKDKKARNVITIVIFIAFLINIMNIWNSFLYLPEFYETIDYLNTLPDNVRIFTPYLYETSYYTNKTCVGINMNLNTNNATHVVVLKTWVESEHWYEFMIPPFDSLEGLGWKKVYENVGEYVLQNPTYNSSSS